jgi:hypothetical protein
MVDGRVVQLEQTRLLREGEAAAKRYKTRAGENRMDIYPMARGLHAARQIYASNQAFSVWLQKSEYADIEKDDRAALINLGQLASQALLQFLGETTLVSPRLIWMEFTKSSSHHAKTSPVTQLKTVHPGQNDLFEGGDANHHPNQWSASYDEWAKHEIDRSLPRPSAGQRHLDCISDMGRTPQGYGDSTEDRPTNFLREELPIGHHADSWRVWVSEQWFRLPLELRRRWWKDTDYGKRAPSDEMVKLIISIALP